MQRAIYFNHELGCCVGCMLQKVQNSRAELSFERLGKHTDKVSKYSLKCLVCSIVYIYVLRWLMSELLLIKMLFYLNAHISNYNVTLTP